MDGRTVYLHSYRTVAVILPVTLLDDPAGLSNGSVLLQVREGRVGPHLDPLFGEFLEGFTVQCVTTASNNVDVLHLPYLVL